MLVNFPLLHTYIEHPHFNKMNYETLFAICSGYVFKLSLPCILCFTSTLNSMLSLFVNSNNNTKYKSKEERRENLHWVEFIYYFDHFWEIFFFIYIQKPAEIDVSAMKSASDSIISYDSRR